MKRLLMVCLMALSGHAFSDWLYNYSGKTLTECDSEGTPLSSGAWVFTVTASTKLEDKYNITLKYKTIGASDKLNLQAKIHGDSAIITALADDFLKNNTSKALLTEVKLPLTLKKIGKEAFAYHSKLVHVEPFLPEGVVSIGNEAFRNTPITNALCIGQSSGSVTLGHSIFLNSGKIPSADIGPGVTSLLQDTFKKCQAMRSVKLHDNFQSLGKQVFESCTSLTTIEPFLPDSLVSLGSRAFYDTAVKSEYLYLKANDQPLAIPASTFYLSGVTNIVFGEGPVALTTDSIMSAGTVKTVKFGKGCLTLPSIGMKAFQVSSYTVRFDVPAGVQEWENFIAQYKFKEWADIPESGKNPSKENYRASFPDGPEPRCLLYIPGDESKNRYVWLQSYPLGAADDKVLYVDGKNESGGLVNFGAVEPTYGIYTDAGNKLPLVCTAPKYAEDGAGTEYICTGYTLETMDDVGGWIPQSTVADGSTSHSFNPSDAGSTHLVWNWAASGYTLTVNMPSIEIGSVTYRDPDRNTFYQRGSTVRLTATPIEGGRFVRWCGDVPEEQIFNAELDLVMDAPKMVRPYFEYGWVLDESAKTMTDGYWTLAWTGSRDSLVVSSVKSSWTKGLGLLDLTKPIIGGGTITGIGSSAFRGNLNIVDIRLPDTVASIGAAAFYECKSMKNVAPFMHENVLSVGKEAFFRCEAITNAFTFGGLKDKTYKTGTYILKGVTKLPAITIGVGVTALSDNDFNGNVSTLRDLTFFCDQPSIASTTFGRDSGYARQIRVHVPKTLPKWKSFIESSVTPWSELSSSVQKAFTTRFGADAELPDGQITDYSTMGGMREQWLFGFTVESGLLMIIR